ncbi:MAG: copper-translocating P-type ATPase, partial [Bullifex sp.]
DTLVSMGASAAFIYSFAALIMMLNDPDGGHMYFHELYFEATSTILTLIALGKTLEARSKVRTASAIEGLMNLAPGTAVVEKDGTEVTVEVSKISEGDVFILYPGSAVPVDGMIISGTSTVDEASLTGESIPVDKGVGENVFSGTMNISGYLRVRATRVGENTTLSQIIKLVNEAASSKAPVSRLADRVSGVFVPIVIVIALLTFVLQLALGSEFSYALSRAVAVLVISCPCALGLATPVAIMAASGKGASSGILFKDAAVLENTGKASVAVFDKTGTVTEGKMKVSDVISLCGSENELLSLAYSLECMSEHPIAKAVASHAVSAGIPCERCDDFRSLPGNGVEGVLDGTKLRGGSVKYISSAVTLSGEVLSLADRLSEEGKTPLVFMAGDTVIGIIAVRDTLKSDAAEAVKQLKAMGLKTVMLTGDNEKTARAVALEAGFDEVISGVLPSEKEEHIRRLQKEGRVIMAGDGINDAPSLTRADIGMAVSGGTDIAMNSADVILMNAGVRVVPAAVRLSRKTLAIIKENLFWAFVYNCIGIPLAAGVFTPLLGWSLNPMFASLAMSLSSVCVVTNALRLSLMDVFSASHDRKK